MPEKNGSLVVVGTGIALGQMSTEARAHIESAEKVVYCVAEAASEHLIKKINSSAESLYVFYDDDKKRSITYEQMVQRTVECVEQGLDVCMVFYGHPGVFVYPSHEAIRRVRAMGLQARMLPAVSSMDCLFADLGIDPATGCQMLEATDFLIRRRQIDVATHVILWQIGCVGDVGFRFAGFDGRNVPALTEALCELYGPDHGAIVYEAAQYAICEPMINHIKSLSE